MSEPAEQVRVRRAGATAAVQVVGPGSMQNAAAVQRYVEQAVAAGATAVRFDLSRCTAMDSTFVGTLLLLRQVLAGGSGQAELVLVCPSQACRKVLQLMALERLFSAVDEPTDQDQNAGGGACEWDTLVASADSASTTALTIVEAHEALAAQSGRTGKMFGPLAKRLRREHESS